MRGSTSFAATARSARRRARRQAERWGQQVAATQARPGEDTGASTGVLLSLAFPDRVARNRGNGIVRAGERTRRFDRSDVGAGARAISCGRRTDRRGREQPHPAGGSDRAGGDRAALRRRDRSGGRDLVRSRRDGVARPAQAQAACDHARRADDAAVAECRNRAHLADGRSRAGLARLPWSKALQAVARPRDVPAQGGGRCMAGPVR